MNKIAFFTSAALLLTSLGATHAQQPAAPGRPANFRPFQFDFSAEHFDPEALLSLFQ